ncbi:head-tail adaptor protein [Aliishimia ponticola]|uniref:Head-tail adaptor protein n=1 Tax=Aliishimia ponticola TaxID=2499833 RepID=A0A4S4NFJ0_9RHOB|nr:phage head closure protein [Aliishimia ponticola]THH38309.1 head-tail adaptor protein [Aliishimia ponticola]
MTLPQLNRRLSLETPQKVPDGAGGYNTIWVALGVLWATCEARTGRERGEGGAPVSAVTYKITVRAAPVGSPSRPRPEQRFREGTRIFNIRAVIESETDGMYLTCLAEEEVVV